MNIRFQCNSCSQIQNKDNIHIELPLTDQLVYEFKCHKDHLNKVVIRNNKFDLLFESGLYALLDGHNREAITSFAVSLERFYEYVIDLYLVHDKGFSFETVDVFKKETKLSERLYGVFCTIYLLKFDMILSPFDNKFLKECNIKFPKFDNQPVKFRNTIIHEGYIPTYEETVDYGRAISKYIFKIAREISNIDKGQFFNFLMLNATQYKKIDPDPNISNLFFETYTSNAVLQDKKTLEEVDLLDYLEHLDKMRKIPLENPYNCK